MNLELRINMKLFFSIFLIFTYFFCFSQINGVILDSISEKEIPYVNIWVEDENNGTTSDEYGVFHLKNINKNEIKQLTFSSLGYEIKKIKISNLSDTILLNPKSVLLDEIVLIKKKGDKKLIISKFKKSKINSHITSSKLPWMFARYFQYESNYEKTPFIKSFTFLTKSKIDNAKFNIRFYDKSKSGEPGKPIYNENIYGYAKKGKSKTVVDISELDFIFPLNGFFVVVEWLIIEENKSIFTFSYDGSSKKHKSDRYNPKFGLIPTEDQSLSFSYSKSKWHKSWLNKEDSKYTSKKFRNKYNLLAVQLELTN